MDAARQHALQWAFFMDIMDMPFDDMYEMYSAWCDSLPEDKMADIMALADGTTRFIGWGSDNNADTNDVPENLYTEADIWNDVDTGLDLDSDFSLN